MENSDTAVSQIKGWISMNREQLLKAGITGIIARYSGEGDSGALEDEIDFLTTDERPARPYEPDVLTELFEKLHDELSPDGYENNDGGGGQFQIDEKTGVLTHESYFVYTERSYNEVEEY